ncbi:MAG: hypothetical protein LBT10_01120 [Methanobrevibacter sp.]|nr:hypothetical protein [Methanobrevibacter sp.]
MLILQCHNISNSNIFIYNKVKMITNNDTTEAGTVKRGWKFEIWNLDL